RAPSAGALMRWLQEQIAPVQPTVRDQGLDPTRHDLGFVARFAVDLAILAPAFALAYLIGANL
ncbi:MAG: hypothetical protein QOD83_335, partial [Solirubrobacteraceae bacterium]|nr:hypothetical protein [Solirubrobacteraceae bacterium]